MTDYTGFGTGTPAGLVWQNDSGAYTFGQRFRVDSSGLSATKIRWFIPDGTTDAPTSGYYVALYEVGNATPVATAGPVSAVIGAWNETDISPVALTLGADYMAAVLYPGGYYGADTAIMSSGSYDPAGPINFYTPGRFNSGASLTYPNSTFGTPWYGVDVTVSDGAPSGGTATLSVTLPVLDVDLAAGDAPAATLAVQLPGLDAELAGQAAPAASLDVALPGLDAELAGQPQGTATLAVVLPGLDAALSVVGGAEDETGTPASGVIAGWFTSTVSIERFVGQTGRGPTYSAATTAAAFVDHGSKLVRAPNGEQVVSSARVFLPADTDAVPLGSRITLPAAYGGARAHVLGVALHSAPGLPVPEHLEVSLA